MVRVSREEAEEEEERCNGIIRTSQPVNCDQPGRSRYNDLP